MSRTTPCADDVLTQLYATHYRQLVRISAFLLGDAHQAEEVVQDAYVAMHGAWRRLDDEDKALAYLRQVVVNRSRSALRRRTVAAKYIPEPLSHAPSAEHHALASVHREEMLTALHTLPRRQRETLVLRYYGDLTEAQIAQAMGISQGAVKSHASRGLAALRTKMERSS